MFLSRLLVGFGSLIWLSCSDQHCQMAYAQSAEKPVASASKAILSMEGRGGKVTLGDSLAQAKKAFPSPQGAQVGDARNFAILGRDGWSWATEKPIEAFEVSLKAGKVVGIARTVVPASEKSRQTLIEQTLQKLGKPTANATGKTVAMSAWDAKPNARFLIEMKQGFMGSGPMINALIGDREELKRFGYRVDDVETVVGQWDMVAEAIKNLPKKKRRPTPKK